MAETRHQSTAYKYTPSSAKSTRQILDSASASTASPPHISTSDPSKIPFRPQVSTRKSSNYAEADARARAGLANSSTNTNTASKGAGRDVGKGGENTKNRGGIPGCVGWKPNLGRKLSWNQQDMKRELQMSRVMDEGAKDLPGFSEVKK